jgi:hypothetical protein
LALQNEAFEPIAICVLGAKGIVFQPKNLADSVEQFNLAGL